MVKFKNYIGITSALLVLASCSNENEPATWQQDPLAMHISAQVNDMIQARSNPVTGSATQFNEGDQISVKTTDQPAVVYTLNGNTWTPEAGEYLRWSTNEMQIEAYYPVVNGASFQQFDFTTATLDQSDLDKIAKADYMNYSGKVVHPKDGTADVKIKMDRKMARVQIIIDKFNDEFSTTTPTIQKVTVYSQNSTAYANNTDKAKLVAITPYTPNNANKGEKPKYTALVAPNTKSLNEPFFTINVNGTDLSVVGIPQLEAGSSYTFRTEVGKNQIKITGVNINKWNTSTLPEGEAVKSLYIDETNYLVSTVPGQITEDRIKTAIFTDAHCYRNLKMKGCLNTKDMEFIAQASKTMLPGYKSLIDFLDLSETEWVGDNKNIVTEGMFSGCKSIVLRLPETTTTIETNAFYRPNVIDEPITEIQQLYIPGNVTLTQENAFAGITNLKLLYFMDNPKQQPITINKLGDNDNPLLKTDIVFPSNLTTLGGDVLEGMESNIFNLIFRAPYSKTIDYRFDAIPDDKANYTWITLHTSWKPYVTGNTWCGKTWGQITFSDSPDI